MKKYTLSIFLMLCLMLGFSNPVDRQTAQIVATNFWNAVTGQNGDGRWTDVTEETPFQEFYLFTRQDGNGFVLVAADDRVQPILGYSTENGFILPLPAHVTWFLNGYERGITYCKEHNIQASNDITTQWLQLIEGVYSPQATTAVSPLLTTTWDQSPYYNNLCPDSSGVYTYTGCVATATSQVMKFWNWPIVGSGSHSYVHGTFGYQHADFGNTYYDWNNMPNSLDSSSTTAQVNAVATLIYHVGVAVEMNYGLNGSSAYSNSYGYPTLPCAENALKDYFRYKSTIHSVYREDVTDSVWISTLNSELNAGRPIIERGSGDVGGHAFVCDGYDNNGLYHINWGWGGYLNGYFAHDNLSPDSAYIFNDGNALVVGIEPDIQIIANPQTLNYPQEGGSQTFTITSLSAINDSWTATSDQSWLSLSPTTGAGSGATTTVTATATPNNSGSARTATITISQGSQSTTVQVMQNECSASDMCTITFYMQDSYGDGWNGAYLTIASTSGYVYGTVTCSDSSTTQQLSVCPSDLVLTWISGYYDNECSFTLTNSYGTTLLNVSNPTLTTYQVSSPCSERYTVSVSSANPEMGTATGGGIFIDGTTIEISASPFTNYEFVRWDDGNTDNPRFITVTEDATYLAEFQPTVGVDDFVEKEAEIYSYGYQIFVNHAEGQPVEIYDMTGRVIISESNNLQDRRVFTVNASGMYLVRTGNGFIKKVNVIR